MSPPVGSGIWTSDLPVGSIPITAVCIPGLSQLNSLRTSYGNEPSLVNHRSMHVVKAWMAIFWLWHYPNSIKTKLYGTFLSRVIFYTFDMIYIYIYIYIYVLNCKSIPLLIWMEIWYCRWIPVKSVKLVPAWYDDNMTGGTSLHPKKM